jgi:nicotinamide-nucleotide amidase
MVPENCTVIQNRVGTAPITWFEQEGKVVVSMPGVPYEMQEAMRNEIIPRLQTKFQTQKILHKTVQVLDIPNQLWL